MSVPLQGSLFGELDDGGIGLRSLRAIDRTELGDGAWIDVLPGWLTGADTLFDMLVEQVPWQAERRKMYDRVVDVPRLVSFYGEGDALPHPVLTEAREALTRDYAHELGEPFCTAGLCYYRDGSAALVLERPGGFETRGSQAHPAPQPPVVGTSGG